MKEASKKPTPRMGYACKDGKGWWFMKVNNPENMHWIGPIELGVWKE